jgi:hypothetical protein
MSVDSKIKELLEKVNGTESMKKDTTIKAATAGDSSMPRQGSSQDDEPEDELEGQHSNMGSQAAKSVNKNSLKEKGAPGESIMTDVKEAVKTEKSWTDKSGNTHSGMAVKGDNYDGEAADKDAKAAAKAAREAKKAKEEEMKEEIQPIDLSLIFGEDLSEDFRNKATSIFEAAVVARVNVEMETVVESLEEKFSNDLMEAKAEMTDKIDSYLNYVVENWMAENELAIENGLRTEIAEDFMAGLKVLFKEHYVEVPEEKYDVLGELQANAEVLEQKLNEAISANVDLNQTVIDLKREAIEEEFSKDLADTESAKLSKLLEGVDFDSESLYREKVSVIKENYFPKKSASESGVSRVQHLVEDLSNPSQESFTQDDGSTVSQYAAALSRSIKRV